MLCLVIPVLYIIETALLLYWTIRWKKLAFLPLCVLAVGLFGLNGFFKPEFGRTYSEPPRDKSAFTVMTYNVMGIMHRENNNALFEHGHRRRHHSIRKARHTLHTGISINGRSAQRAIR
ncbi:MAG: hypothetical protein L6V35_10260 [Alistipes putredinis]|nr:MAG: hypothetical protein L6V35_10260 [Alistipes putredinis]